MVHKNARTEATCDAPPCLVLLARNFHRGHPNLLRLATENGWAHLPRLGAIIPSGPLADDYDRLFRHLTDRLPLRETRQLRIAWIWPEISIDAQLHRLIHAETLDSALTAEPAMPSPASVLDITTWFQPIVNARTLDTWGYECLVRGVTETGDAVGADVLFLQALSGGYTTELDDRCQSVHLRNAGRHGLRRPINVLINFMPAAVGDPQEFAAGKLSTCRAAGLDPRCVIFEVVETDEIRHHPGLSQTLGALRAAGFRIAIDDLGSGYAGLKLLGDLDPDIIKIDRELICMAARSRLHRQICAAIVQLGRTSGKVVIAEGIETPVEFAVMAEMGVDLLQGYYFGTPAPAPCAATLPSAVSGALPK